MIRFVIVQYKKFNEPLFTDDGGIVDVTVLL
jgi:hypothetical protein